MVKWFWQKRPKQPIRCYFVMKDNAPVILVCIESECKEDDFSCVQDAVLACGGLCRSIFTVSVNETDVRPVTEEYLTWLESFKGPIIDVFVRERRKRRL